MVWLPNNAKSARTLYSFRVDIQFLFHLEVDSLPTVSEGIVT